MSLFDVFFFIIIICKFKTVGLKSLIIEKFEEFVFED